MTKQNKHIKQHHGAAHTTKEASDPRLYLGRKNQRRKTFAAPFQRSKTWSWCRGFGATKAEPANRAEIDRSSRRPSCRTELVRVPWETIPPRTSESARARRCRKLNGIENGSRTSLNTVAEWAMGYIFVFIPETRRWKDFFSSSLAPI